MDMILYETVSQLIQTKREGDYWDFKVQHYTSKAALLHDILCMANSQDTHDCYIIIGIADKTHEIVGVEENEMRFTQQNIIDFIKSKKFAGDHRPQLELHTLPIDGHEVDVIIVFNTMNTPFYLSEDYIEQVNGKPKTIRANAIYSRVGDTNTPVDRSADYSQVEYLWRKRLGLHLTPFEKLCWLLHDKAQWENGEGVHFRKFHPEYTLRIEDQERETPEFYSYMMTNESTSYGVLYSDYFATTLYSHQVVWLDSGRYVTVIPEREFIPLDEYHSNTLMFRCFVEGTIDYLLHEYLYDEESHEAGIAKRNFLEVILVFSSKEEKAQFLHHATANLDLLQSRIENNIRKYQWHVRESSETAQQALAKDIGVGITLNEMLTEYRIQLEETIWRNTHE